MTNIFLKVNKDFFLLGLTPIEILILAQVLEYDTNTGDCFMSDKALAENFGVSESTVSRAIKALEGKKFIIKTTKNVKGGRVRHININHSEIEKALTNIKMSVDDDTQPSKCLLTNVNLPIDNRQNDFIKDKGIDNIKDNKSVKDAKASSPLPLVENTDEFKF